MTARNHQTKAKPQTLSPARPGSGKATPNSKGSNRGQRLADFPGGKSGGPTLPAASTTDHGTLTADSPRLDQEGLSDFLEDVAVPLHCVSARGVVLWANQRELDMLGYRREEYVGHSIAEFHVDGPAFEDFFRRLNNHEALVDYGARLHCKDGSIKDVVISGRVSRRNGEFVHAWCFTRDNSWRKKLETALKLSRRELELKVEERSAEFLAANSRLQDEIDQRKRYEEELQLLLGISREVTSANDFASALQIALYMICEATDWATGEAWIPTPQGDALKLTRTWQGNDGKIKKSRRAGTGQLLKKGKGLPGKVMEIRKPVWIPDLKDCGYFSRATLALKVDFHTAFAVPVFSRDSLVAVLAFFSKSAQPEDGHLMELTSSVANQLGNLFHRKQVEEQLIKRDRQLAEAQKLARLGSWEWDMGSNEVTWSKELFEIFGLSPRHFDGTFDAYISRVHPEDRDGVQLTIREAAKQRKRFVQEERIIRPDGVIRNLHSEGAFVDPDGQSPRMVGFCQDVTDRKKAEEALYQLASLVQASEDAIVGKHLDGTIFSWNPGAEKIFGYSAKEMVGDSIAKLIPPECSGELQWILKRLKRGKGLAHHETIRLRKDGTRIAIQLAISPIRNARGKTIGASVLSRDISRLKRLEALVLDISEREQRRIGQDIHDGLNQELSAVVYMCHLLAKNLKAKGASEANDAARIVELMNHVANQARAISRGLLPIKKKEPGGLAAALRKLAEITQMTYEISVGFEGDHRVRIPNTAVATHLYRIAQEATSNAIRHGKADRIGIRLKRLKDHVRMVVEDNGSGLPKRIPKKKGMGLESMNIRARAIGATLTLQRRNSRGTRVECLIGTDRLKKSRS